jgi:hypothetical protein
MGGLTLLGLNMVKSRLTMKNNNKPQYIIESSPRRPITDDLGAKHMSLINSYQTVRHGTNYTVSRCL